MPGVTPGDGEHKQEARRADAVEKAAWTEFTQRVRSREAAANDARYLKEVEAVALGRQPRSRVLRDLGREETPESAHALLLETGFWPVTVNPYPCLLYTSPSPRDRTRSRMPSSA